MNVRIKNNTGSMRGTLFTFASFALWGVLPGYWKMLVQVPSLQIVGHRTTWTCIFAFLLQVATGRMYLVRMASSTRRLRLLTLAGSFLIGGNWLIYIYAVNSGHIVQASLGYYINPLVSIILGMVVLGERLSRLQHAAFWLAAAGVTYMTISLGSFPWIAIALALSFGLYGLVKKKAGTDSLSSLALESLFLLPLAIPAASGIFSGEFLPFGTTLFSAILLILGGFVTGLPLFLFAEGAKSIPLARVGFLQYISPTLSLIIGVFVYNESFTLAHAVSFGFIWAALLIYSASELAANRKTRRESLRGESSPINVPL